MVLVFVAYQLWGTGLRTAIAGHRATYGAPFDRVDGLEPVEGANLLTLTSCHPKYSELAGDAPAAVVPRSSGAPTEETAGLDGPSLSGDPVGRWPAVGSGALATGIRTAAAFAGRRWRGGRAHAVAIVAFAVALFSFFEQTARFLPADH